MKSSSSFLLIILFLSATALSAQELYMPRAIKEAYAEGTRDFSGEPGENYWQNHGVYDLKIKLTPPDRLVTGNETIVYTNNSPDTLKKLNFKLIANVHKLTSPRWRVVPKDFLTTGLHIDKYVVNGQAVDWPGNVLDGTNKWIELSNPLLPGESINLYLEWHYQLSKKSGREGVIFDHTFFLAYFYPRIAVYDDYNGWDRMPHNLAQEFYNDFNDYTLAVTVPKNYVVWATGVLQNAAQVLKPHYAQLYKKSKTGDALVHIITEADLNKEITKQKNNTWIFKAQNITDVALAVSNEYKWDASSVELDDGRRISVQAAYNPAATDFEKMVQYTKHAIQWFSEEMPGMPYPYPKMTVVRGYAGMEYPMMANDNSHPDNPIFARFVAEHEIAHTYFPFFMGTNQTRFGFMDEGWATTFEYLIGIEDLGRKKAIDFYRNFRVKSWINDRSFAAEIPIIVPSNMLSVEPMKNNEYEKASLGYLALRDLLGPQKFLEVLHGYMNRWKGKHPTPWDFFYSFNDLSGKNLNWFWERWFFSHNYIDFGIEKVQIHGGEVGVEIRNIGGFPAPFDVKVKLTDGRVKTFHQGPGIWKTDKKVYQLKLHNIGKIKSISLYGGIFIDADLSNNTWVR